MVKSAYEKLQHYNKRKVRTLDFLDEFWRTKALAFSMAGFSK